jgi:cytochrome b561
MALLNSTERYGTLSIAMHWLPAVLMVAAVAVAT